MKTVWIEHKEIGAAPKQVEMSAFEKLYGSRGWSLCDPPEEARKKPVTKPSPNEVRAEEFKNRSLPTITSQDPDVVRRQELAAKPKPTNPVDPDQLRRDELKANAANRVVGGAAPKKSKTTKTAKGSTSKPAPKSSTVRAGRQPGGKKGQSKG